MERNPLLITARIVEPEQRLHRVLTLLCELTPEEGAQALNSTLSQVRQRDDAARLVLECLLDLPEHENKLGSWRLQELYQAAHELGFDEVQRLLRRGRAARKPARDGAPDNAFVEQPLGTRKTLARSHDRLVLDRIMRDRHPAVVRILLDNPRIVERDVVMMAAQQPNHPDVLIEIVRHPRWVQRYQVQKALVFNPYLPVNRGLPLLEFLTAPDLRELSTTPTVAPELRVYAARHQQARRVQNESSGE